jgi:hypothetical protein
MLLDTTESPLWGCRAGATALVDQAESRRDGGLELGPRWLARSAALLAGLVPGWEALTGELPAHRAYRLLARSELVEAWLVYWPTGGNLQLHDHGGASGAYTIVEGTLEEIFTSTSGEALRKRDQTVGTTVGFGHAHVHHVSNTRNHPAASVHVYNRPLATLTFYRLDPDGKLRTNGVGPADEPAGACALTDLPVGPDGRLDLEHWSRELPQACGSSFGGIPAVPRGGRCHVPH